MTKTHRFAALLLCCLGLAAFDASAEPVIGLHIASAHLPDNGKVNNINPGAYVSFDSCATFGFYRNSLRRMSVYAGCTKERGLAGVTFGAVTGYGKLQPLVALHLKSPVQFLGMTPQLTYIPGHVVKASDVLHFSISRSFK